MRGLCIGKSLNFNSFYHYASKEAGRSAGEAAEGVTGHFVVNSFCASVNGLVAYVKIPIAIYLI